MECCKDNKAIIATIIAGLAFVLGLSLFSYSFYSTRQTDDTIAVTGSAKMKIVSDSARWSGNFSRVVAKDKMKNDGYGQMKKDEQALRKYFKDKGVEEKDVEISPVSVYEIYKNDGGSAKEYNFSQNFTVKSGDVAKMKALVGNIDTIVNQGVVLNSGMVEYYYSNLPETRIALLPDAIKDARARAEKIAEATNKKITTVKSVTMGVVQMMPAGTVDITDYGTYDNTSVEKDVMVAVKAEFNIE